MKAILFLIFTMLILSSQVHARQTMQNNKKSHFRHHKSPNHLKINHKIKQFDTNSQMIELPLKTQRKSAEKRLDQVNELAKHQALLLQKDEYTHVEMNQLLQAHVTNMIQLKPLQQAKIINKQESIDSNDKKEYNLKNNTKQFLKIKETSSEKVAENENTITDLSLTNHQNTFYTGQVAVGSEDNLFNIIFDTGSSLTFVNSSLCKGQACQQGSQYDSSDSDSHEDLNAEVEVEFGSGTLRGNMSQEDFYINSMRIPETIFIEIKEMQGDVFDDGDFDGIVGLSFPDLGDDTPTLFDFMIERKVIAQDMFSFYMDREDQSSSSKVTFGGYDRDLMAEDPQFHDVNQEYYWMIEAQKLKVGDQDTGICSDDKPCKLVLDSGTSLFTGPTQDLQLLLSSLETQEGCKNLYDLPDITFVVDGTDYPIAPEEYILTVTKNGVEQPHQHSSMDEIIQCVGAFYALDIEEPAGPLWVMGDVFMSSYYTVFKKGEGSNKSQIGLAKVASN